MKLKAIVVTQPIFDWRPLLADGSRRAFLSEPISERVDPKPYIKGFGFARNRDRRRMDWRPEDSAYFDCRWAISLPQRLPDLSQVTHVVRRLFLDGRFHARFEIGIYTNPNHHQPPSRRRMDEYAREFWGTNVWVARNRVWTGVNLGEALRLLAGKFADMTSASEGAKYADLCRRLQPQLQLIVEASERERHRAARPIDDDGKIFIAVVPLKMNGEGAPIDTVLIQHHPGYINFPPGDEFIWLRKVRAHLAWTHGDLEVLTHALRRCTAREIPAEKASQCLREITGHLRCGPAPDDPDHQTFSTLTRALIVRCENDIKNLLGTLTRCNMTAEDTRTVTSLVERYLASGRRPWEESPLEASKPQIVAPAQGLNDRMRNALNAYGKYYQDLARDPRSVRGGRYGDEQFQKGAIRKAKEVVEFLKSKANLDLQGIVFVSIGGADGTELVSLLKATGSRCGALLEYSDRSSRDAVHKAKEAGFEIEAFTGDLMQKIDDALDWAIRQRDQDKAKAIVITAHAVLHELEDRSTRFTLRRYFAKLGDADIIIGREPVEPTEWDETVLLSGNFDAELFGDLARLIKLHIKTFQQPRFTLDRVNEHTVELHRALALETLTKAFYSEDFLYELEECVTTLLPSKVVGDLTLCLDRSHSIGHERMTSVSMDGFWDNLGLTAMSQNGARLGKPLSHLRYWAGLCP